MGSDLQLRALIARVGAKIPQLFRRIALPLIASAGLLASAPGGSSGTRAETLGPVTDPLGMLKIPKGVQIAFKDHGDRTPATQ